MVDALEAVLYVYAFIRQLLEMIIGVIRTFAGLNDDVVERKPAEYENLEDLNAVTAQLSAETAHGKTT